MTNAFAYVRYSPRPGGGSLLTSQLQRVVALLAPTLPHVYVDGDNTGIHMPLFREMIQAIHALPDEPVVGIDRIERLGRCPDVASLLQMLRDKRGTLKVADGVPWLLDAPEHRLAEWDDAAIRAFQSKVTSQHDCLSKRLQAIAAAGRQKYGRWGRPRNKPLTIDPAEIERMRTVGGLAPATIAQQLGVSVSTLNRRLRELRDDNASA